jgi:hypothetical protein
MSLVTVSRVDFWTILPSRYNCDIHSFIQSFIHSFIHSCDVLCKFENLKDCVKCRYLIYTFYEMSMFHVK